MAGKIDINDLLRRAIAAYLRAGGHGQPLRAGGYGLPTYEDSAVRRLKGKYYVVLRNANDSAIGAVYRVRNDGMLKRMIRLPKGISSSTILLEKPEAGQKGR